MYVGLIFGVVPAASVVLNTAWPNALSPALWAYLHFVVAAP